MEPLSHLRPRGLVFQKGLVAELALLAVAVIWAKLCRLPLGGLWVDRRSILIGVAATLPPSFFLVWTLRSNLRVLVAHRRLLDQWVSPLFSGWSLAQLAVISVVAGIAEEALFRGAIQGSLARAVGAESALVLASVLFGAAHLITWTYAVMATVIGAYLGVIWLWTGNLVTAMVVHALYDFVALVYLLRVRTFQS